MTISYIIFVQPAVLAQARMDFGAVMTATCVASAIRTFLMGLMANYPVAMAPVMGHNFFFAFSITEGIAFVFISYSLLKVVSGKGKSVHWLVHVLAILFLLRYFLLKT